MKRFIEAILTVLALALLPKPEAVHFSPVVMLAIAVTVFALVFFVKTPHIKNVHRADSGLDVQVWGDTLMQLYWKYNGWTKFAVQVLNQYIYNSKVVHIPKVNTKPGVTKNRTVFPAEVQLRTDIDILYLIDAFFVDPFRIPNAEKYELSYNKRASILMDQSNAANEAAAEQLLYNWLTYTQVSNSVTTTMNAKKLFTSGDAVPSHLDGTTGNRKLSRVADLAAAKKYMNKNNVPLEGRYAMYDSDMLDQLTQDDDYKKAWKVYEQSLVTGTVGMIHGFQIMERSSAARFAAANTPLVPGAVNEVDTNAAAVIWQTQGVETAMGGVEWFDDMGNPLYYGDIASCILRAGGRIRRDDSVISLIQAPTA